MGPPNFVMSVMSRSTGVPVSWAARKTLSMPLPASAPLRPASPSIRVVASRAVGRSVPVSRASSSTCDETASSGLPVRSSRDEMVETAVPASSKLAGIVVAIVLAESSSRFRSSSVLPVATRMPSDMASKPAPMSYRALPATTAAPTPATRAPPRARPAFLPMPPNLPVMPAPAWLT